MDMSTSPIEEGQAASLLALFSHRTYGRVDFQGTEHIEEAENRIFPDPDDDLTVLQRKSGLLTDLVLEHKSLAAVLGLLRDDNGQRLSPERLALKHCSPVERAQWQAWNKGFKLPPMTWAYELQAPLSYHQDSSGRSLSLHSTDSTLRVSDQGQDAFILNCKIQALEELYSDDIEMDRGQDNGVVHYQARGNNGPVSADLSMTSFSVCADDVKAFENLYHSLIPLLTVQARVVACRSFSPAKTHFGTEYEMIERKVGIRLIEYVEQQLDCAVAKAHRQAEQIRQDCEVVRARVSAMSAQLAKAVQPDAPRGHSRNAESVGRRASASPNDVGSNDRPHRVNGSTTRIGREPHARSSAHEFDQGSTVESSKPVRLNVVSRHFADRENEDRHSSTFSKRTHPGEDEQDTNDGKRARRNPVGAHGSSVDKSMPPPALTNVVEARKQSSDRTIAFRPREIAKSNHSITSDGNSTKAETGPSSATDASTTNEKSGQR